MKQRVNGRMLLKGGEQQARQGIDSCMKDDMKKKISFDILYGLDDNPPWYNCLVLGLQHYLLMFGGTVALPLLVTKFMCIGDDEVGKSEVISTAFFVSGLSTFIQATFGSRLPIVQGGSFAFVPPVIAILTLPHWQCPADTDFFNATGINSSHELFNESLRSWKREVWTSRMREVQGSIIMASLFEVLVGFTGLIGCMLRFIGPLAIAPTIVLIGLQFFEAAAAYCSKHWGIAFMTATLITLFSQYLREVYIPVPKYTKGKGWSRVPFPLFKMFPVFLSMVIVWVFCFILTVSGALATDSSHISYGARTDIKLKVLSDANWFRFPYPGQFGLPTFSTAGVVGMLSGVIAGMIESVGDYFACARIAGAPPLPVHALNRGILFEGIGIVCAGLWGTGCGLTSYSQNIGAIGITKVASRRVIQVGAGLIIIFGVVGKFGALFVTMPEPIIGGIFLAVCGMVSAVGVSNLQFVALNSSRNLFVFGFALFSAFTLSSWIRNNPGAINTGVPILDQVITVLLGTSMFVGGVLGCFLDNTIPGTVEERGIVMWRNAGEQDFIGDESTYDLPLITPCLKRTRWLRFVPVCSTYTKLICCRREESTDQPAVDDETENTTRLDSVLPVDEAGTAGASPNHLVRTTKI